VAESRHVNRASDNQHSLSLSTLETIAKDIITIQDIATKANGIT
jgi:hypothetical protein